MFDDLPPDLERLHALRIWTALCLQRIDRKIAFLQQREAEAEHGRQHRPPTPDWIVELGIGAGRPPLQVHAGDCHMAGKRRRAVDRDEARRLLAEGLKACSHCHPDVRLRILEALEIPRQQLQRQRGTARRRDTGCGRVTSPFVMPLAGHDEHFRSSGRRGHVVLCRC